MNRWVYNGALLAGVAMVGIGAGLTVGGVAGTMIGAGAGLALAGALVVYLTLRGAGV